MQPGSAKIHPLAATAKLEQSNESSGLAKRQELPRDGTCHASSQPIAPVGGELAFKRRLADQTIRGNGFANGNSQGRLAAVLGRPLSPRVCRPIALDAREPRYSSF